MVLSPILRRRTAHEPKAPSRMAAPLFSRSFWRVFHVSTTPRRLIAGGLFTAILLTFVLMHTDEFLAKDVTGGGLLYGLCLAASVIMGVLVTLRWSMTPQASSIFSTVLALFLPVVAMTMAECLNGVPTWDWSFQTLLLNYILYSLFYGLIYVCSGSFRLPLLVINPILFTLALANFWVYAHRGTPFIPMDFFSIGTAMGVISNYDFSFNYQIVISILLLVFLLIAGWKLRTPTMDIVAKIASRVFFGTLIITISALFFFTDEYAKVGLRPDFWNQARGYHNTGVVMNFCLNTKYLYMTAPSGYDADEIESIVYDTIDEDNSGVSTAPTAPKTPNIICIMNESLADLSVLGEESTNMDYMPYLNSLTENTVRGNLYVPVIGSGTSNTEFEFLTGASTSFFPAGSNAYMLYMKNPLPSLVSTLMDQGYSSRAFHPYYASGWNRLDVYDYFGFSRFTSLGSIIPNSILKQYSDSGADSELLQQLVEEAFPGENTLLRRYVSDERNYREIIDLYERRNKSQPFFLFNVTMQNHGGYTEKTSNFVEEVYITDLPNGQQPDAGGDITTAYPKANQFYSLMKRSDEAFATLIDYFSQQEEPTVICMFGDHQPGIEQEYIEKLLGADSLYSLSVEDDVKRYVTPFYIWANYDIEEKTIERLSSNYLSSYVLDVAGVELPAYNEYLLKLSETLPVITNAGLIDADGNHYTSATNSPYNELLTNYKKVVYNYIFDNKNKKDTLYNVN